MTINLSTLLAVTFAVTGLACVGTLQAPKTPGVQSQPDPICG